MLPILNNNMRFNLEIVRCGLVSSIIVEVHDFTGRILIFRVVLVVTLAEFKITHRYTLDDFNRMVVCVINNVVEPLRLYKNNNHQRLLCDKSRFQSEYGRTSFYNKRF